MQPWETDLEYQSIIADIKDHPFLRDLAIFRQHFFSNRLLHSYEVSYKSYCIAKKLHLNYRAVARAGLLHDLFYYYPGEVHFSKGGHLRNHPYIAYKNACVVTTLSDMEKDIILKHMWLISWSLPRYKESFVVTFVDKYVAFTDVLKPSFSRVRQWARMKYDKAVKLVL